MTKTIRLGLMFFAISFMSTANIHAGEKSETNLPTFRTQEFERNLKVGYAVLPVDVNHDDKMDFVVVDTTRVVWYENPTWKQRLIISGKSTPDNVCISAYDIDGDGLVDLALGAGWRPANTKSGGTLQWLKRGKTLDEEWSVHPIGTEPTVHRIRFADVDGNGKAELLVGPLFGRNSSRQKNWMDGLPVRLLAFHIPKNPIRDRWTPEVLDQSLHVMHNFWPIESPSRKGKDILTASYEGVSLVSKKNGKWMRRLIGKGNQEDLKGRRGASEIKMGKLKNGTRFIVTIEPWHGHEVVVYTEPKNLKSLWNRHVIDDELRWGHAVWCADLNRNGSDEIIIGVRDDPRDSEKGIKRRGVRLYQATDAKATKWARKIIEHGGVAVEDLAPVDLDNDGWIDIVAVGRQTHNARIYWNEGFKR